MRWVIHTWWRIVCIIFRKLLVGIEKGVISFKDKRTAQTGQDRSRAKWINHFCLDKSFLTRFCPETVSESYRQKVLLLFQIGVIGYLRKIFNRGQEFIWFHADKPVIQRHSVFWKAKNNFDTEVHSLLEYNMNSLLPAQVF